MCIANQSVYVWSLFLLAKHQNSVLLVQGHMFSRWGDTFLADVMVVLISIDRKCHATFDHGLSKHHCKLGMPSASD